MQFTVEETLELYTNYEQYIDQVKSGVLIVDFITWIKDKYPLEKLNLSEIELVWKVFECVIDSKTEREVSIRLYNDLLENYYFHSWMVMYEARGTTFFQIVDANCCPYLYRFDVNPSGDHIDESEYDHLVHNEFECIYPNFYDNMMKLYEEGVEIDGVWYNVTDTFMDDEGGGTIYWKLEGLETTYSFAYWQQIREILYGAGCGFYPHPYYFDLPKNPFVSIKSWFDTWHEDILVF
jgi:hypothetical protein